MQPSDWTGVVPRESKIAVIVPMYGYWSDVEVRELTPETLQVSLLRLLSYKHKVYYIFVGENSRVPADVKHILAGRVAGGNVLSVEVQPFSPFGDYLSEGISTALEETDAQFVVVANPWTIVQKDSLDKLVERINRSDVSIVSGYDLRTHESGGKIGVPSEEIDSYVFNPPIEIKDFNLNFWGMTRQRAEMLKVDVNFRTHYFLPRDVWQISNQAGLEVISSQFFPIYTLPVDWKNLEEKEEFDADYARFMEKWRFDPAVKYE